MKTFLLSSIALSVQAHPLANNAESNLFGPPPNFPTNSYDPAPDYGPAQAPQSYAPVASNYGPASVGPNYEEDIPADDGCSGGLGSGILGIGRGKCRSKVKARHGLLGSRLKAKNKASFTGIGL
ncbi:hypothetical protein DSO57_1011749 [Entomophthora muscae]|uniref:Uncharacterized protein n=1 Tax=Entomophthora muscae TaxID=34485 RepID=A0ACC2U4M1_9FUNG|nr:hypothetical protein DSO57_1011749 [Entomophthora muscae]